MREIINYLFKNYNNLFPISDIEAWIKYPNYNIIYNKLQLAEIQGLDCAPIPVYPNTYPIVIKPIINLYGMSRGFYKINNKDEYKTLLNQKNLSGYFWETYLAGGQFNIDIIFKNGKIIKYFVLKSKPIREGIFKYHKYINDYKLDENIINILEQILDNYTGFINIELIDGFIIEAHLRLNGDFFIFNEKHIDSLINFIKTKNYIDIPITPVTFFPIFITDTSKNYEKIGLYLKENKDYLVDFYKDDIHQLAQGDKYKRCYYFITNNFKKGLEIQKNIYQNLI